MKEKLDKAWKKYRQRFKSAHWLAVTCPQHLMNLRPANQRPSYRRKFEKYATKLIGPTIFEWQENGDCIVAGIIYLVLIETA
jgi:hypothetical protein